VVWFVPGTSVYHSANVAALLMWAVMLAATNTGLPAALSMVSTSPVVAVLTPVAPGSKSAGMWNLKSRLTIGTWIVGPSGGCLHMKPDSIWQVDEQPSPETLLPSSHCSPESRMPSPHFPVQGPLAVQLGSTWQVDEQPSYGTVLPSSHPSDPSFLPSPQVVAWHSVGVGVPVHAQPGFQRQVEEQAFFSTAMPGSHCSVPMMTPSPQFGTHGALRSGQT